MNLLPSSIVLTKLFLQPNLWLFAVKEHVEFWVSMLKFMLKISDSLEYKDFNLNYR